MVIMIFGEIIIFEGDIELNVGCFICIINVVNIGDCFI